MRSYDSAQDLKELFVRMVEHLGKFREQESLLTDVIKDICGHFRFGCGFIYERDHAQVFHLRDFYSVYPTDTMRESFRIEEQLCEEDRERLAKASIYFSKALPETRQVKLAELFSAGSLIVAPILTANNTLVGLVGMADRRREILLDDSATLSAQTVLKLVANHAALRICRKSLAYSKNTLQSILDNMGVDIYVNDFATHEVLFINKSMAAPYGGRAGIIGKKCWEALYSGTEECAFCPQKNLLDAQGKPVKTHSWEYQRPMDDTWVRVFSAAFPWVDGRLAHVVSSVDITENKINEEIIRRMAEYDDLTGLPNRRKLLRDCKNALTRSRQKKNSAYLLFFDLDNFKIINDTLGHHIGDLKLARVGRELRKHPLTKDHCYRHGGDEFILFYEDMSRDQIEQIVRVLLRMLTKPMPHDGRYIPCGASIGVARFPEDAPDAKGLIRVADSIMYKAKQSGKGVAAFSDGTIFPLV